MNTYVLEGPRWGTAAPLTWAVDNSVPVDFVSDIKAAFADWSAHANVTFQQIVSAASANIRFSDSYIDGPSNVVGEANYSYSGQSFVSTAISFDSSEGWRMAGSHVVSSSGTNLFLVALHEIGHALGLDHYDATPAVMNTILNPAVTDLTTSDISGIQALYGSSPVSSPLVNSMTPESNAVFRFYDTATKDHFYTTDIAEKDSIVAHLHTYQYEGAQWSAPDKGAATVDVFRFYDTAHDSHFFTTDPGERDSIMKNMPSYHYEGVAFEAYANAGTADGVTLERFYNTQTGVHHYSANAGETYGINHGAAGANWIDEGAGFNVHLPTDGMLHA